MQQLDRIIADEYRSLSYLFIVMCLSLGYGVEGCYLRNGKSCLAGRTAIKHHLHEIDLFLIADEGGAYPNYFAIFPNIVVTGEAELPIESFIRADNQALSGRCVQQVQ